MSTTYRVILPREKHLGEQSRGAKIEGQNLRVKNRHSEFEGQNASLKIEGQNLTLQRVRNETARI